MISIRMLKICGKSISKPLEIVFKSCIEKGQFPNESKKVNVVPVHKKVMYFLFNIKRQGVVKPPEFSFK